MANDDLRERVAEDVYWAWCKFNKVEKTSMPWAEVWGEEREVTLAEADAAIAIIRAEVLEEAARVCQYQDEYDDAVSAHAELMTCARIAAAIRKLKEKT